MRVLVCGGRDYSDRTTVYRELDALAPQPTVIIHGGARGADSLAEDWAASRDVMSHVWLANWKAHGRAAGPIRNSYMLTDGKPDLIVAFPGGRGTADMIRQAKRAGVTVLEVEG